MKKITFPEPVHEKAIAILEQAQKDLEALGYDVSFTKTMTNVEHVLPEDSPNTLISAADFEMELSAVIDL